jgi:hypothetical protein
MVNSFAREWMRQSHRRDLDSGPRALKFEARHANRSDHQGSERIVGVYEVLHPQ